MHFFLYLCRQNEKSPKTGEIVAEEEFEGETTMSIPEEGNYELYIYTESGTVMVGEFSVE